MDAAYDISDSIAVFMDLDEGYLAYSNEAAEQGRRTLEARKIDRRKERAKHDVAEELEAAGRPDLVAPFQAFIDKYLGRRCAARLVEELFNEERG